MKPTSKIIPTIQINGELFIKLDEYNLLAQEIAGVHSDTCEAREIPVASCFEYAKFTYMRVKPINFLNNSNVIQDILVRGDIIAVEISSGKLTAFKGDRLVRKIAGSGIGG